MHFARTEEQEQLAELLADLLARRADSAAVRAALETPDRFDRDLWQLLCDQVGVAALPIPEEYDGAGATLVESAIALEEIGFALAPVPLLAGTIATAALLAIGTPEQRDRLLPRIASGEIATLADPLTLDGEAAAIVLAPQGAGLVEADADALVPVPTMDPLLRLARAESALEPWPDPVRDLAVALTTAVQLGVARRGLRMTVDYSLERVQFGRPIGSFQALKHRMADLLVLVEAGTSASWAATAAAAAYVERPDAQRADLLARRADIAAAYVTDALDQVASETVQLHGGIAITWEHDAHLVLKRAQSLGRLVGSAGAHRRRVDARL